jgi:hypothetical protein
MNGAEQEGNAMVNHLPLSAAWGGDGSERSGTFFVSKPQLCYKRRDKILQEMFKSNKI